jgi:hypothetical protein
LDKKYNTDDLCLSFWYLPDERESKTPEIIEFSFDYYAKDKNNPDVADKNSFIEEFPISLVRKANDFYLSLLQEQEFLDLKTAKTKTEFAYTYKRQL